MKKGTPIAYAFQFVGYGQQYFDLQDNRLIRHPSLHGIIRVCLLEA